MYTQDAIYQDQIISNDADERLDKMEVLFDTYQNALYQLCCHLTGNRHNADDLFQDTWLRFVKSMDNYSEELYKPILFKICINRYRDNYRKAKRRKTIQMDDFQSSEAKDYMLEIAQVECSAEDVYQDIYIKTRIIHQINQLSEKLKHPLILFYYHHLKYEDIARILSISVGTVKSRMNAAKKKLHILLEGDLS